MGKEPEQTSLQRRYSSGQQVYGKGLKTTNHQRNANQKHSDT